MIENRNVKKDLEQLDSILKEQGISRRDAMKMMGFGSASLLAGATQAQSATTAKASGAKVKIVIIGGGLGGMSTAARLTNNLSDPDITVIEPNDASTQYQPGQTLVGGGIWEKNEILYKRDDFVPTGVKIIKEKAIEFDPDNNTVTTSSNQVIKYDYLVVSAGIELNYGAIKGLEEVGALYAAGDNSQAVQIMNSKGVSSIYTADGAEATWTNIKNLISNAKKGQKQNALYTHPNTPIKCGGAPKKIMYLTDARLNEASKKARENVNMHFYPNGGAMFGIKDYHTAIVEQFKARDFKWSYKHNLVEIKNGMAIFDHHGTKKGAYDEDLEEYEMITTHEEVQVPFDFIHVTPPMRAAKEIADSPIGSKKGWVPVNKETLQHVKYKNIFALGDIAAVPMGKTGGSARKQYKVVVDNLISMMETGKIPEDNNKYDGYTVCPLVTGLGTVMLAEFNWASKKTGSGANAAILPLDPTQERYIWWLLKVYLLKPMTQYGMLAGRA